MECVHVQFVQFEGWVGGWVEERVQFRLYFFKFKDGLFMGPGCSVGRGSRGARGQLLSQWTGCACVPPLKFGYY